MSKELSHLYPDCSSVYNSSRQRSNSVLNQLSYTSRQNIQQSASKSNLNCVKYQQEYQYSS